jgi:predicted acetyltransferase
MEIRRIHSDEWEQCRRIWTIVYNDRQDISKPAKADPLDNPVEWTWASFENGTMKSCLCEIEYLMRFDTHNVKMSGIGNVGTLPEARRGGHVRLIFEKLLPEAFERDVIFSNLTPFSHAFYRNFGYELACARNEVSIPTRELAELKLRGSFTQIFPGDDTTELAAIHSAYIANLNHGICRDYWAENRAWRIFTKSDPFTTGIFLYLWRNNDGKPAGYIKYQHEKKDVETMKVKELAFIDRDALFGVLSIVSGLSSQYKTFKWPMPTFIDPTDFISDMWEIEQRLVPRDMTRVINVQVALSLMRHPQGEGSWIISVVDKHISANTGTYLVEYGVKGNIVTRTSKEPDIVCTMPVLSQLVTGYRTLENALLSKQMGLEVRSNREILDKVFTLRLQHITEYF